MVQDLLLYLGYHMVAQMSCHYPLLQVICVVDALTVTKLLLHQASCSMGNKAGDLGAVPESTLLGGCD